MSNFRFIDFIHSETKTSYKFIETTSYIISNIALLMPNKKEI